MIKKSLLVLIALNFVVVISFVISFGKYQSFVPLYIGILPLVLCNFIYVREFVAPRAMVDAIPVSDQSAKKLNVLPLAIMPLCFVLTLPALIKFDSSLGWSPSVSIGFSVLLSIVIIAFYGSIKTALKSRK